MVGDDGIALGMGDATHDCQRWTLDAAQGKIFVQIASYRDPDCSNTINDLFAKARYPDRVFVGVNSQYHEDDGFEPVPPGAPYVDRVRIVRHHCTESKGVCWARAQTQALARDENYTLQTDAHMRFVRDWDSLLIDMLEGLRARGHDRAVISHYPPNFTPEGEFDDWQGRMGPYFRADGIVIFKLSGYRVEQTDGPPLPSAFVAGGFFFADSRCIQEIPYDPNLYFQGEEVTLSARFWTHGWDIFNPSRIICHHMFKKRQDAATGQKIRVRTVKVHKDDNDSAAMMDARSIRRVRTLMGAEDSEDQAALVDLDKFGLGSDRSLSQYERYCGIDFKRLTRDHFSRVGIFFEDGLPVAKWADELPAIRERRRRVGTGAPAGTGWAILRDLGVRSVLDIEAGSDMSWTEACPEDGEIIATHSTRAQWERQRLLQRRTPGRVHLWLDPLRDPLPAGDAVLCRHLFESMSINATWQLLGAIRECGAGWVISTLPAPPAPPAPPARPAPGASDRSRSEPGNLLGAPFFLPPPVLYLPAQPEGAGLLAVWRLTDVEGFLKPMDLRSSDIRRRLVPALRAKLEHGKSVLESEPAAFKHLLWLMQEQVNSKQARDYLKAEPMQGLLEKSGGEGRVVIDDVFRVRYWSNEAKILKAFPFLSPDDKMLVIAMACETIGSFARTLK